MRINKKRNRQSKLNAPLYAVFCIGCLFTSFHTNNATAYDNGFYAGIDIGMMEASLDDTLDDVYETGSTFGQIYAGYQFHKNFAGELGYFQTTSEEKQFSGTILDTAISATTEISYTGIYLDFIGNYEVMDKLNILGSLGYAHLSADASATVTAGTLAASATSTDDEGSAKVGIGASYDITDHFVLRTKADYIFLNDGFTLFSLGAQYRFTPNSSRASMHNNRMAPSMPAPPHNYNQQQPSTDGPYTNPYYNTQGQYNNYYNPYMYEPQRPPQ